MHYGYILKSLKRVDELYIGYTPDLVERIKKHNAGKALATKRYRPWKLVYAEIYASELDARDREKKLKQFGRVYSQLKRRIALTLQC